MHKNDPEFHRKVILSDEAFFHLGGLVNKQNCRIWSSENPRVVEKPLYPQRVTVWCGLWSSGGIGPYFFENEAGASVTVNGLCYREMMINYFLWPKLDSIDLDNFYSQQDGATCHTSNETIDLSREKFPERCIPPRGNHNWPPRSCDFTPCEAIEDIGQPLCDLVM